MASAITAADQASTMVAVERAKALAKLQGANESLICTQDIAHAYIDHVSGSGAEQTAATAKLAANKRHKQ